MGHWYQTPTGLAILMLAIGSATRAYSIYGSSAYGFHTLKPNLTCSDAPDQLICLPAEYDPLTPPLVYGRTQVWVNLYVEDLLEIDEAKKEVSLAFSLLIKWKDDRIRRRRGFGRAQASPGVDYRNNPRVTVPQDMSMLNAIWHPDLFIYNSKQFEMDRFGPEASEKLYLATDGTVLQTMSAKLRLFCPMTHWNFPMDKQTCPLKVGSFSHEDRVLVFRSEVDVVALEDIGEEWQSSLHVGHWIRLEPLPQEKSTVATKEFGNFSVSGLQITLTRKVATFFTSYYLPSGFLVVVSWISFLVPSHLVQARVSLLALTFLILINIMNSAIEVSPKADTVNALQVWLFVCICFVFVAFMEFGVLLWRRRKTFVAAITIENVKYEAASNGLASNEDDPLDAEESWKIDRYYLIVFPLLFLVFNLAYWLGYTV